MIAIYSRKSRFTGTGDSIENQIEICKEYAYFHFGENIKFTIYDDEGYSGKNTDRPEFQKLLTDINSERFDVLMCYRLDRISRSVSDFSSILDNLNEKGIAFISVKECFDTSTPMGRAMIHIASVFAELERETIAERIKDNKYRLYRTGYWQGGSPPMGFSVKRMQEYDAAGFKRIHYILEPNKQQIPIVQFVFSKYLECCNIADVETCLQNENMNTVRGNDFTKSAIRQMLRNPVYASCSPEVYEYLIRRGCELVNTEEEYNGLNGLIGYAKTVTRGTKNSTRKRNDIAHWIIAVGQHPAIIEGGKWAEVQKMLDTHRKNPYDRDSGKTSLFSGLICCGICGANMIVKGNRVNHIGEKIFYYKCKNKDRSHSESCKVKNIAGLDFDRQIVLELQTELLESLEQLTDTLIQNLHGTSLEKEELHKLKNDFTQYAKTFDSKPMEEKKEVLRRMIHSIIWYGEDFEVNLYLPVNNVGNV